MAPSLPLENQNEVCGSGAKGGEKTVAYLPEQ